MTLQANGPMVNDKTVKFEKKLLLKKIAQMTNIPTPSGHIMKVMLLLRDEEVRMGELIEAIEHDQTLVAQILKLINSGYYGLRKTIDTVERAVNLLGILALKQVVYSASIMDLFSDDEQEEWNHAYSSSVLMSTLVKENDIHGVQNLSLTMLMHDLGKVILRRFNPKKYRMVLSHAVEDEVPVFRAEESIIHINHADAAAVLMEKWDMTDEILKPVLYHHMDNTPEDYVLETALTQFVNWVDCQARNIVCFKPSQSLMDAAGIEEIHGDYWINYQRNLIMTLEGEDAISEPSSEGFQPVTESFEHQSTARIKRATIPLSHEKVPVSELEKAPIEETGAHGTHGTQLLTRPNAGSGEKKASPAEATISEEPPPPDTATAEATISEPPQPDTATKPVESDNKPIVHDTKNLVRKLVQDDDTKVIKRPPKGKLRPEPLPYARPPCDPEDIKITPPSAPTEEKLEEKVEPEVKPEEVQESTEQDESSSVKLDPNKESGDDNLQVKTRRIRRKGFRG